MRILTRHIVASVLFVGFSVTIIAAFMMLGVDLFKNLDNYVTYSVSSANVVKLTFLYFPQAVLFTIGPAFLFSVTYFLSMLHANNEIIAILNSSIKYSRVIKPILITGVFVSVFFFAFSETVAIRTTANKTALFNAVTTGESQSDGNSYNISMSDMTKNYMVYAGSFANSTGTLYNVRFIKSNDDGSLTRINGESATWNNSTKTWTFNNARAYVSDSSDVVDVAYHEYLEVPELGFEPDMFRNLSDDVASMPLEKAGNYVKRMRMINISEFYEKATTFYDRIFNCLTPLVLIIIACSMNYRLKKNVLFISIIFSVAVAVVYYVVRLMTTMMATQGIIRPYLGTLLPFAVILILSSIANRIMR